MTRNLLEEYMAEVDSFYTWSISNSPSSSSISLWHALLHTWKTLGRPEEFAVPLTALSLKAGMSKNSVLRARNALKQSGRLTWTERSGNRAAKYRLVRFGENLSGLDAGAETNARNVTQSVTQDGSRAVSYNNSIYYNNINDNCRNGDVAPTDIGVDNKKNYVEIINYFMAKTGNRLSGRAEEQLRGFLGDGVEKKLALLAIDASVDAGANNWLYVNKMLERCVAKGVLTSDGYLHAEALRNKKKAAIDYNNTFVGSYQQTSRKASGYVGGGPKKTRFSNFRERDNIDFDEVQRLEMERIDKELGINQNLHE